MTDDDPTGEVRRSGATRGEVDPDADVVREHWPAVEADAEDLAAEYRDRGWTVHVVHSGTVTPLAGDDVERAGLDVLAPDDEFDAVREAVEAGAEFDDATVYRRLADGVLFLVTVWEAADAETVVVVPAYYSPTRAHSFAHYLNSTDTAALHLRPLDRRALVTFEADDPSLFQAEQD